jgi:hypothetical protein
MFDPKDKELNEKHMPQETSNNTTNNENVRPRDDITQAIWRDYKARSHHR